MTEFIISFFLLLGAIFSVLGSLGLLRLPDVYARLHAATKTVTFGIINIMIAVFLYFALVHSVFSFKVLLTIVFVFLTAPVAAFMISRSAYRIGVPLWEKSIQDDLKEAIEEGREVNSIKKDMESTS
ncbi:monovalent cation/H(+) antiporter subunit G [Desulfuribacillus alkaliarsenatis]|uniref:monovalent cation/H(+) antiporter subunit G n=1 Tax=Desulfuribacillus alkaliarsenatis TaxID=766136 RepID=UPI000AAE60BA|nr:monovalent cation/H(+) antiporter subunit G [Desulfuribacillus alkaliarsenatis]